MANYTKGKVRREAARKANETKRRRAVESNVEFYIEVDARLRSANRLMDSCSYFINRGEQEMAGVALRAAKREHEDLLDYMKKANKVGGHR